MKYYWLLYLNKDSEMQIILYFWHLIKYLSISYSQIDIIPPRQQQIIQCEIPVIYHIFNILLVSKIIVQLLILYNFSFLNDLNKFF